MTFGADLGGQAVLTITGWARTEGDRHLIGSVPVTALEEQWRDQRVTARLLLKTSERGVLAKPQAVDTIRSALTSEPGDQTFEVVGPLLRVVPEEQQLTVRSGHPDMPVSLTVRATTSLLRQVDPAWAWVHLTGCLIDRMLVADTALSVVAPTPSLQRHLGPLAARPPAGAFARRPLPPGLTIPAPTDASKAGRVLELRGRPYTFDDELAPYIQGLTWSNINGTPSVQLTVIQARGLGAPFAANKVYTLRRFFAMLVYGFGPRTGMTVRHTNGDTEDYSLANLEPVTAGQAQSERSVAMKPNGDLPAGVTRNKAGTFRARASLPGRGQVALGTYPTAQAASEAREKALRDPASVA